MNPGANRAQKIPNGVQMKTATKKDILQLAGLILQFLKSSDLSRVQKHAALSIASLLLGVQTQDN